MNWILFSFTFARVKYFYHEEFLFFLFPITQILIYCDFVPIKSMKRIKKTMSIDFYTTRGVAHWWSGERMQLFT